MGVVFTRKCRGQVVLSIIIKKGEADEVQEVWKIGLETLRIRFRDNAPAFDRWEPGTH